MEIYDPDSFIEPIVSTIQPVIYACGQEAATAYVQFIHSSTAHQIRS